MSLLPKHHDEFRSKEYWDRFFQERNNETFEWYGTYAEISDLVAKYFKNMANDKYLVIGCGNSAFSSDLYESGYHNIRNLDFSELVIEEMRAKHSLSCPTMMWDIGDMTAMTDYADGSFDVVVDKGALDALMSVNSLEVKNKTIDMFNEILRVLSTNGKYVCITLAESYIIDTLLSFFSAENVSASCDFSVTIECIQSHKISPFNPFSFVFME